MNLSRIFVFVSSLSITALSHAALAPNYQRLAELQAILAEPAVAAVFDVYHPINRVEFIREDLYRVTAGSCHVNVTIADKPAGPSGGPPMVGARQFVVNVGKRTCS